MQQRQLRLGDILDDYCPRERRVTNHAVVAMLENEVKQTRCTTCDTDHEYKHAKVPRQRRKTETPAALYSQVLANAPKRVSHDGAADGSGHAANADAPPPVVIAAADVVEDDDPRAAEPGNTDFPDAVSASPANDVDDLPADLEDEEGDVNGN